MEEKFNPKLSASQEQGNVKTYYMVVDKELDGIKNTLYILLNAHHKVFQNPGLTG